MKRLAETRARSELARVVTLAANTGQRGSDLVKMRWTDIEVYNGLTGINVTQKKTGRQIWVPITQELSAAMAGWERQTGIYPSASHGHRLDAQGADLGLDCRAR